MSAITSHSRRYWLAGAAILAVAVGAYGIGRIYPPSGPGSGAIAAAQGYVDHLAGGEIPERGRYVLVDAASARLFMIEDGRVRDTMRVIVGKPAAALRRSGARSITRRSTPIGTCRPISPRR